MGVVGGTAIPVLEAWILAIGGENRTEELSKTRAQSRLRESGIQSENTAAMVQEATNANLSAIPKDAEGLRTWIEMSKVGLPRSRRHCPYAAMFFCMSFNSNSIGLTWPIDECRRQVLYKPKKLFNVAVRNHVGNPRASLPSWMPTPRARVVIVRGLARPDERTAFVRVIANTIYRASRNRDRVIIGVRVNKAQPAYVFPRLASLFPEGISRRTVAVWELAFKLETDDVREGPVV